jgi:hypothetical protein
MYYLDVNFYYYYIGRQDQSVNQKIMLSRIDQQIRVNKIMVDYYVENYGMIRSQKERHKYMFNYLEIITAISSVLLNSLTKYSNRVLSKSSPPRKVSPFVAFT